MINNKTHKKDYLTYLSFLSTEKRFFYYTHDFPLFKSKYAIRTCQDNTILSPDI